jgi:hypothetical protein
MLWAVRPPGDIAVEIQKITRRYRRLPSPDHDDTPAVPTQFHAPKVTFSYGFVSLLLEREMTQRNRIGARGFTPP